ncbi:hypothetical protein [Fulvivirga lutimaris]|uniref:hypothetical protein n=1 Tax=Fulvivirga lutimaris TaxID=1819566 RepID=UPI0012BD2996|nr:hypothetical protein [Fulvivirga lutimaris]MTI38897.1 hypothetical protein [Fulvivirga lutimaris]
MREEELIKIWKKSSDMSHITLNMPLLVTELRNRMESLDGKIGRRDRREIIASVVGMIGFAVIAFIIPYFWTKVSCLLTIVWFAYVIYRLKSASKDKLPDTSLSLFDQLSQRKQYLMKQAKLLNSVFYWYILPPFITNIMFVFGVGQTDTWDSPLSSVLPYLLSEKLTMLSLIAAFYAYITWMNRQAARSNYAPLIREIERVQEGLTRSEEE